MQINLLPILLLSILSGCNSSRQTALDHSLQEYRNSQWLLSEKWAQKSIESNKSIGESQYMMGLCEFQLKHLDKAQEWFTKAATSTNEDVHGKATAMLGIIATNKGDYETAEVAFRIAANELQGIDKREATTRTSGSTGANLVSSQSFSLQFGAYRDKANADVALSNLSTSLKRVGINSVWITEDIDRTGRTLYLVQAGHFSTRASASNRKRHGNLPQCIVIATD